MAVSVSNVDLMERVCHLTNKIYREILFATRCEKTTYITMGGFDSDHVQVNAFSWTPQYRTVLSWTCWPGYLWRIEFSVPLLTLLQLQSYLVPCISARIFIILKLQNIHWRQFFMQLLSVSTFISVSNIFLIVILLGTPPLVFTIAFTIRTGAIGNTFPVLFQLKWLSIYSDQFLLRMPYQLLLHRSDARYARDYCYVASGQC